jgi:hypothetical protein
MLRYIFSINTGRSGSHYLNRLFEHVENCESFHEPPPKGHKAAMRAFLAGNDRPMRRVLKEKLKLAARTLDRGRIYVETNHCFIKGFGWLLPEFVPQEQIGVVVLSRDPEAIVASWMRKRFTPLTRGGPDWLIMPNAARPLAPPPMRFVSPAVDYRLLRMLIPKRSFLRRIANHCGLSRTKLSRWAADYERDCLHWYVEEIRRRAEAYRQAFPGIRYHHCSLEDLNDPRKIGTMLDAFGCVATASMSDHIGRPINDRPRHARAA